MYMYFTSLNGVYSIIGTIPLSDGISYQIKLSVLGMAYHFLKSWSRVSHRCTNIKDYLLLLLLITHTAEDTTYLSHKTRRNVVS